MDKLITGIIIVAVVGFFYWLYSTGGDAGAPQVSETAEESAAEMAAEPASEGSWVAIVGVGEDAHVAGHYNSYAECYQDVGSKVDVNVTPYSCTNQ